MLLWLCVVSRTRLLNLYLGVNQRTNSSNALQQGPEETDIQKPTTMCSSLPVMEIFLHHGYSNTRHASETDMIDNRFSATQLELNLYPASLSNGDIGGKLEEWGHLCMEIELTGHIVHSIHPRNCQLEMAVRVFDKHVCDSMVDRHVWVTLAWNDALIEHLRLYEEQSVRHMWSLRYRDMVLKEREQQTRFDVLRDA